MKTFFENHSDTTLFVVAIIMILFTIYLFIWTIGAISGSFETASSVSPGQSSSGGFDIEGANKVLDARGVVR